MDTLDELPHFESSDPLIDCLNLALLPEMEFHQAELDLVVESLRHLANRALACLPNARPGGVSITLMAPASARAVPVNLRVALGHSLGDALGLLADATGLAVMRGALGLLICPKEAVEALRECVCAPIAVEPEGNAYSLLGRDNWLHHIAHYPILAVSGSATRRAWAAAVLRSDKTPQTIFALASEIVRELGEGEGECVAQIPRYLPAPLGSIIPGIDD